MEMWITRDSGGALLLHTEKPILYKSSGIWDSENWFEIDSNLYPEVTFENSPQEIELIIKK